MEKPIPENTRWLLISVFKKNDSFFRHIYSISERIKQIEGFAHYPWKNKSLDLRYCTHLEGIIFSGHGSQKFAKLSNERNNELKLVPDDLKIFT